MALARHLETEWLDILVSNDSRALRSRQVLARINLLMLQSRIMTHALQRFHRGRKPRLILDLGAGDARFMLRLARRLAPIWPEVSVISIDRQNIVSNRTRNDFQSLGWRLEKVTADVFDFLEIGSDCRVDIIVANLFLHHFQQEQLSRLLNGAKRLSRLFVACEPRRGSVGLAAGHLLWAIGCNDVSRHDALASVRAGFRAKELSALWPAGDGWEVDERAIGPLTHRFVACLSDVEPI